MGLIKRVYTDEETLITAKNLNDIQDAVIALEDGLFTVDDYKSGEVINITDAAQRGFRSLKIYGKTTQDGTPAPDAPVDLVSVGDSGDVTVYITSKNIFGGDVMADRLVKVAGATKDAANGTVVFDGTSASKKMLFSGFKENTQYTIILKGMNSYGDGSNLWVKYTDGTVAYLSFPESKAVSTMLYKTQAGKSIETLDGVNYAGFTTLYYNQCGIFEGDVSLNDFVECIGESMILATPNGLPGIPVTSGGNYTDANGQRWICDEIDLTRGVYIQRVAKKVLDGEEVWSHSGNGEYFSIAYAHVGGAAGGEARCSHFIYSTTGISGRFVNGTVGFAFFPSLGSLSEWKAFLSQQLTSGTPVELVYILAIPIETPLSAEGIAAYAALHTYRDHTTVSNDASAHMELEYVMDAKKYIDSLFAGSIVPATVE